MLSIDTRSFRNFWKYGDTIILINVQIITFINNTLLAYWGNESLNMTSVNLVICFFREFINNQCLYSIREDIQHQINYDSRYL